MAISAVVEAIPSPEPTATMEAAMPKPDLDLAVLKAARQRLILDTELGALTSLAFELLHGRAHRLDLGRCRSGRRGL